MQVGEEEVDVSRVLFSYEQRSKRAIIYLGHLLPNASSGSLLGISPATRDGKKTNRCPICLASNRGLPSQHLSMLLVRSYRTFAPLPLSANKR